MNTFRKRHVIRCGLVFIIFVSAAIVYSGKIFAFQKKSTVSKKTVPRDTDHNRPRGIPRIIHLIWNNESVPTEFVENVKSFVRNNPAPKWEYYFWTKDSGRMFIKEKYPAFYKRFTGHVHRLVQADLLRVLAVHYYGGFYFDMDTISVRSLDEFADSHNCSLALEPGEHYFIWNVDILITNAALACVPQHPFYKLIINKLSQQDPACSQAFKCTGPVFITKLFRVENQTLESRRHLPDLQPSEVFQDVYDVNMSDRLLNEHCVNKTRIQRLHPKKRRICKRWIERGMGDRKLSSKALTYHTWFHTNIHAVSYLKENTVFNILPNVKIYGKNLN